MRCLRWLPAAAALATLASCGGPTPEDLDAPAVTRRKSVAEVEPLAPDFHPAAGQTIYVPAYSSIFSSDRANPFNLAITLSIRNTDPTSPILVTTARYYDHDGQLVRDYLRRPLRVGPRASLEYFVSEKDTSGGISASFYVAWVSDRAVTAPVVESVMVGTAGGQGVSLSCPGRVLADHANAGLPAPAPPPQPSPGR